MNPINAIFNNLDEWRKLPSYQLERRFDIFLSLYIPQIIEFHLGNPIDLIIPEFPIRTGDYNKEHRRPNKSFKIDYLALSKETKTAYLIELKTDHDSIRQTQSDLMKAVSARKFKSIIEGIITIHKNSKKQYLRYSQKHYNLLKLLEQDGLVEFKNDHFVPGNIQYKIEILFILPQSDLKFDFKVITFKDIIEYLKTQDDNLSQRMIESLEKWQTPVMSKKTAVKFKTEIYETNIY